jgi:hypothetical protein
MATHPRHLPAQAMALDPGPSATVLRQLVARDHPGELGGRMASPTFVGRVEELQSLEAATGWAATTEPTLGGRAGEDDRARSPFVTVTKLTGR